MSAQVAPPKPLLGETPHLQWRPSPRNGRRVHLLGGWRVKSGSNLILRVMPMHFKQFSFGSMQIDGRVYDFDLVIDRGEIRKRKKKASKRYRDAYGHTPVSIEEDIPWRCSQLVVGTGAEGRLPVMPEVERDAQLRKVKLVVLPTKDAIAILNRGDLRTNAILHVTC